MQKFEVLLLHVLRRVRRNTLIREDPIAIARACSVEAQLSFRREHADDDAGFEVDLERDGEIEVMTPKLLREVGEVGPRS
jgi:hypothetical protein